MINVEVDKKGLLKFPCVACGKTMRCNSPYEFYCSKKCEKKDRARISRQLERGVHPIEVLMEAKF